MKSKAITDSYPAYEAPLNGLFSMHYRGTVTAAKAENIIQENPSFPDNKIMIYLQFHVPPKVLQSIIFNCYFSMFNNIQLTKDFALGAEYDTINTIRG